MSDNEKANAVEEKKKELFREESLNVLSSPEDLDRYIRTTKPKVWILLIAILIFLVGVLVWANVATVSSKASVGIMVKNGEAHFYVKESDIGRVSEKSTLKLDGEEYAIVSWDGPFKASKSGDAFILHASEIADDEWYYEFISNVKAKDGEYTGYIIFEKISPITLIFYTN